MSNPIPNQLLNNPLQHSWNRRRVYKRARKLYMESLKPENWAFAGLCDPMARACDQLGIEIPGQYTSNRWNNMLLLLVEFRECKPEEAESGSFWWEPYHSKPRLEVLDKLIKL